jgi:hypothetical protein
VDPPGEALDEPANFSARLMVVTRWRRMKLPPPETRVRQGPRTCTCKVNHERLSNHGEINVNKNDTVALIAATIYAAGPSNVGTPDREAFVRVAAQAWALYDAVEEEAAQRLSKR